MAITYYPAVPAATEDQDQTQPQILANFTGINNWTAVNHYNFADANSGKHKFLQMPEQSSAPAIAANEGALYTKEGATSTVTELAFRRESGAVIEMTATGTSGTTRWSMLPSGLLMKWGTKTAQGINQAVDITGGPGFSSVFSLQATGSFLAADNIIIRTSNLNTSQFLLHYLTNSGAYPQYTLVYSGGPRLVYWTVIGIPT